MADKTTEPGLEPEYQIVFTVTQLSEILNKSPLAHSQQLTAAALLLAMQAADKKISMAALLEEVQRYHQRYVSLKK